MNDVSKLDRDLVVIPCDRGGLRYEKFDERTGQLTAGPAFEDEGSNLVLVVDHQLTRTRNLEAFEIAEWRQSTREAPMWDETATYSWKYAPGPWLSPVEDSEEIAVMSGS